MFSLIFGNVVWMADCGQCEKNEFGVKLPILKGRAL